MTALFLNKKNIILKLLRSLSNIQYNILIDRDNLNTVSETVEFN